MIHRRELLQSFGIGAALAALAPAAGKALRGTAINHLSYMSADYQKTRDFYVSLFGFQASEEDDKQLYLWAGDALISAKNTPAAKDPRIDHFGLTVDPWDLPTVEAALTARGLTPRVSRNDPHDSAGKSAFARDPNGCNLQLGARDLEVKPAPVASKAPLRAIGINHFSYQCADYKKTCQFYSELLDVPISQDTGKQAYLWFGDAFIVIKNNPSGSPQPVIDHMAWTLADWDKDRVSAELKKHGLEARPDAAGKSVMTKDLNGYPLQLCAHDLEKKS